MIYLDVLDDLVEYLGNNTDKTILYLAGDNIVGSIENIKNKIIEKNEKYEVMVPKGNYQILFFNEKKAHNIINIHEVTPITMGLPMMMQVYADKEKPDLLILDSKVSMLDSAFLFINMLSHEIESWKEGWPCGIEGQKPSSLSKVNERRINPKSI